jgi:branched-chain amino acid transport system substrate-binding protein
LPGININTSPSDYFPVELMLMTRYKGQLGERLGPVIGGVIGTM